MTGAGITVNHQTSFYAWIDLIFYSQALNPALNSINNTTMKSAEIMNKKSKNVYVF
jgi:hypothetical protein